MKLFEKFRRNQSDLKVPTAITDGITNGPGGTWAWVLIPPRATDELNTSTIFRMTDDGASDLRRLIPAGAEFHFKVQWGRWSGEDYEREEIRRGMPDGARSYIKLGARRIDENRFARRMVLLGVRMDEDQQGVRTAATATAGKVLGTSTPTKDATVALAGTVKRIRSWQERMRVSSFAARPATTQELSWSLRRDLRRTVDWVPSANVVDAGLMGKLKATQVIPHATYLEVSTDAGPRYLRLITSAETGFPTSELELPGGEWLKDLNIVRQDIDEDDDESAPVEVSIRGRNVPQKEAVKRLRAAQALAKEQDREARRGMAEEAPDAVAESGYALRDRLREVSAGLIGMIEDAPVWVVEGTSVDQLDARSESLIDHYGAMGVTVWTPPYVQDLLWKETVIGDTRRVREFTQFRPVSTLVGAWFHGGSEVGGRRGPYLAGNIGSTPGPFRNRLTDAQQAGDTVTTAYLGKSGAGKSTALMLSLLGDIVTSNGFGLLTDLKGDLAGIINAFDLYGVPTWTVSTSQQASGSMDAFRYIADPDEARSEAIDNLAMMLSTKDDESVEWLLRPAATAVAAMPNPADRSSWAIVKHLLADENLQAREMGRRLQELSSDPRARPVIGRPDFSAPPLPTGHGLVYMRFDDLKWPGKDTPTRDWKPGHRLSMMVAQAGLNYATHMSTRVKGLPKVIALTELHRLTRYDFGRQFVGDVARTGRALDTNLLLDTQACAELVAIDGLPDQISQVHAFRVDTDAEADAQAVLLHLEPEQQIRNRQKSWSQGQCLTRDRAGRIAPIEFDYMSDEIREALNTRPERDDDNTNEPEVDYDVESDVHATAVGRRDEEPVWETDTKLEEEKV
jgi:hypothetical protein